MRRSEDFVRLGSVLNCAYRDMFLGSRPAGHLYEYVPPAGKDAGPLPVILFLHGSLGNFKGYLWVWKRLADRHGYAVVAPTFGAGNWYLDGGAQAVERARSYCARHPRMDAGRIFLAGLSNGGTGTSRAAAANPEGYAGLVFISPVMEPEVLSSEAFAAGWKGRRVLVLSGSEDRRIPIGYVRDAVKGMAERGAAVTSRLYPGEDHFLLFSRPEEVMRDIAAWLPASEAQVEPAAEKEGGR
jgi:pimeloyl-ACP methyl ester carboxylesterase